MSGVPDGLVESIVPQLVQGGADDLEGGKFLAAWREFLLVYNGVSRLHTIKGRRILNKYDSL